MFSEDQPRTWSEMSFEFKGMFLYHIVMMVMFVAGGAIAFTEQILIAAAIILAIALMSLLRRVRHGWHWRGVGVLRAAGAVLMTALMGYFLFAGVGGALQAQGFALDRPFALGPWALAGLGIAIFAVLNVLRITHLSEKAFQNECGDKALEPEPAPPPEPRWKTVVKYVFIAAFLAVWLEAVTAFYVFDRTFRGGAPVPTAGQSAPLTNHGVTVYVTADEKRLVDQLQGFMFVGIPAAIATAFFLHFVLKIRFQSLR